MERTGMENEKNEERNGNWLDRKQDELRMGKWKNGRKGKAKIRQDREWNGMERTEKWTEGEDIELIEYRMLGHEINRIWDGQDME